MATENVEEETIPQDALYVENPWPTDNDDDPVGYWVRPLPPVTT